MPRRKVRHQVEDVVDEATAARRDEVIARALFNKAIKDHNPGWVVECFRRALLQMRNEAERISRQEIGSCPQRTLREAARLLGEATFEDDDDADQATYTAEECLNAAAWFDRMAITVIPGGK